MQFCTMPEEEPGDEENREEYYLETIQHLVDQQKEDIGEEAAIKWARRAPLRIDANGNVQDFYGKGEDALETLRTYTEHEEFYLDAIQAIIDAISNFMGDDIGMGTARKAPLQITPDGEVQAYYGTGRKALEILMNSYEDYMGATVADTKMRNAISQFDEEKYDLVPEQIRPRKESEKSGGLLHKLLGTAFSANLYIPEPV